MSQPSSFFNASIFGLSSFMAISLAFAPIKEVTCPASAGVIIPDVTAHKA